MWAASFSLGSVVGDISSVSLHESSAITTNQPILTKIELGEPITVTNLNQLRITYYRFLDLTGWVSSNGDLIMKEFNGDGYIAKWTPLTLYSNQIIIRFRHYYHSTSRATGYLHNNDTQEGGGVYATYSPSTRWEGDEYIKEITLGLKIPPSHKNYTDIEFDRVRIWAPVDSTPMNFYFDEAITKTNRETFEFSVTIRVTFSMDDDFTQQEMDNILDLI